MSEITAPALMSLEGRANLIADEGSMRAMSANPKAQRERLAKIALAHLRAALEQDRRLRGAN